MPATPSATNPPDFSPEFADEVRNRLRSFLGPTWERIQREDDSGLPERDRHLLAILDQRAGEFKQEFRAAKFPGHMPDFMALFVITEIFQRMQDEEVFPQVIAGLANRGSFRHDMLTFGLADHFREHTEYPVRLPARGSKGARIVDLVVGAGPEMDVETKSSDEFDGPRRHVSDSNAFRGIQRAWRRAFGGETPQLTDARPSAILVGGVTVELASLPSIARVARRWLERKGQDHRNCWGILVLTYLTYSRMPAGRAFGDGKPLTVDARAGVHLAFAKNPHYDGAVDIVFTPPEWA